MVALAEELFWHLTLGIQKWKLEWLKGGWHELTIWTSIKIPNQTNSTQMSKGLLRT